MISRRYANARLIVNDEQCGVFQDDKSAVDNSISERLTTSVEPSLLNVVGNRRIHEAG